MDKTTTRKTLNLCIWLGQSVLTLALAVSACTAPSTPGPTSTPPPLDVSTPVPTWTATPPPVPALPLLPTAVPQPTATAAPTPTPFPDEQEIVDAVLALRGDEHWVAHRVGGSFTAPDVDEWLALAGNIGDHDEVRWVVIGQADDGWQLRGTSNVLATGFGDAPPYYFPPDPLDFDGDGQQELLVNYFKMQWGWMTASDTLYCWDGRALASVWGAPTIVDNRMASNEDVPQLYRENYQAEWEWADLDGDGLDEILLREHVAFYLPGEEGYVDDDAPSIGEESGERVFRWDGGAFRPFAPAGPAGTFAYVEAGNLWLWQNRAAHPLSVEHVQEFHWSPDGQRLAWWAQPSPGEDIQDAILGIYDLTTGLRWEFSLDDTPSALYWAPDGRLAYVLPGQPLALLDPGTGQQRALPTMSSGTWSPDGNRIAYERDGNLYVYDLSTGQEWLLVVAPEGAGQATFDPVWSPRADWIACTLETDDLAYVGLVSPEPPEPVSAFDLLEPFDGREAPVLRFAWSPDGSHLAALTTDPRVEQQPAVLYVAGTPSGGSGPVGRLEWREVLQLETVAETVGLAWSPDGGRVVVAAGNEVWEVTAAGETTLWHRFSVPEPGWLALEWAPDGSGFLAGLAGAGVGYEEHLYWFPAGGAEPVLLLAGFDAAHLP